MNSIIIHEVINRILAFVRSNEIIDAYDGIIQYLTNSNEEASNENQILKQKIKEISTLLNSNCFYQSRFLFLSASQLIGAKELVGDFASKELLAVYDKNKHNTTVLLEAFTQIRNNAKNCFDRLENTQKVFAVIDEGNFDFFNKSTLLNVYLPVDNQIGSLEDAERFIRFWNSILTSFCHFSGYEEKLFQLAIWNKEYTCIQLEEADDVLDMLTKALIRMLTSYRSILKIRFIQTQVTELNLNPEIISLLEAEIDANVNDQAKEIIEELAVELGLNKNTGDYKEIAGRAHKSLLLMLDFIEKGGKIDWQFSGNMESDEVNTYYNLIEEIELMQIAIKERNADY